MFWKILPQVAGALQQAALGVGLGSEAFLATFNKSVPTALGLLGELSAGVCCAGRAGCPVVCALQQLCHPNLLRRTPNR